MGCTLTSEATSSIAQIIAHIACISKYRICLNSLKLDKMVNRPLSLITAFLLLSVGVWVTLHRTPLYYAHMGMDATKDNVSISFLLDGQKLAKCPECRIKILECLDRLSTEQERQLSDAPLNTPSARMSKGVVLYSAQAPEVALSACKESERQSTVSKNEANRVTCFPPEAPRPQAKAFDAQNIGHYATWQVGGTLLMFSVAGLLLLLAWHSKGKGSPSIQYRVLIRLAGLPRRSKQIIVVASDVVSILVSILLSSYLRLEQFSLPRGEAVWPYFVAPLLAIPVFISLGMYRSITRYFGVRTIATVFKAVVLYIALLALVIFLFDLKMPRTALLTHGTLALLFVGASRLLARYWLNKIQLQRSNLKYERSNILIYGAGSAGVQLASALEFSRELRTVAFIDDDTVLQNQLINGLKVYGPHSLLDLIERYAVDKIILAMPSTQRSRRNEIMRMIEKFPVTVLTLPGLDELAGGMAKIEDLRKLDIEDLLGRDSVPADVKLLEQNITGKSILVTGAAGSIGSELCRQVLSLRPNRLVLYEQNEFGLYDIEQELLGLCNGAKGSVGVQLIPILGSVTDQSRFERVLNRFKIDTVFHAAAYKHVPIVEQNPSVGTYNNILGTWRAAQSALACNVGTFVLISTDKAVRPTNTMGTTKRFAEMILQALAASYPDKTRFTMVRFGNVLGSSGSVVPLFREQIKKGGPITVTDPRIIRYFMTIPEAAQLVIQAGAMGKDGDVFVLDMGEPVKILDLARQMIRLSGLSIKDENNPDGDIEIVFTGLRKGEKMYEELLIGDSVEPTINPRILRANEESLPLQEIRDLIHRIEDVLERDATDELRTLLMESVRGFSPQCSNEDLLTQHDPISPVR
jgi:FlaA1/EpsC-like NDP-sugar epimerase